MSRKSTKSELDPNIKIEVIAINRKGEVFKKTMTYEKSLNLEKKKGFTYIRYQVGFSQFGHCLEQ
jgi:hypothetical protein